MKTYARNVREKILSSTKTSKVLGAFLVIASIVLIGATSVANAAPNYFSVVKPSSVSQCYGGTWHEVGHWHYWHHSRRWVWTPNWQKLGFSSFRQCVNYVSTPKPTSARECTFRWWQLGFNNRNQCIRYLKLHPGSGYGGNYYQNDAYYSRSSWY
jgi:hypothetical protein